MHDPIIMTNQSSSKRKSEKEVHASSKSKDAKTPKKRSRKVAPPINQPTLHMNMKYVIKHIPKHSIKFGPTYNSNFNQDLVLSIKDEGMELFKDTIFAPYLNIPKCNYQGQIINCLYLLEVEQDNLDKEIHIRHAKGNVLQFSIKEFAIITGLKCKENIKDFTYSDSLTSRLVQRYFSGPNYNVNKGRLVDLVYSQLGYATIPIEDFFIVEDDNYEQYPWG
ncbi:hypothetical protein H5410_028289 [Solanum commersonii]|uniref:DUF1985 domain-containing protein n=1 Tax=Solanum commersonii TaxID=4109 RepID=A0A9J5Z3L5_SOLCO|nr:hypothetical protein H5410_028289 [Solanum commersonii]